MTEEIRQLDAKQGELLVLTQFRKHLGSSAQLQKLGFEIRVQVNRLSQKSGSVLVELNEHTGGKNHDLKRVVQNNARPLFMLRAQHEIDVQEKLDSLELPVEQQPEKRDRLMRENYVYPKGGYTKVEVKHPITGKMYVGEAHCNICDVFARRKSNFRAFGRVYREMLTDSSMGFKRGKEVIGELAKASA